MYLLYVSSDGFYFFTCIQQIFVFNEFFNNWKGDEENREEKKKTEQKLIFYFV